MKHVVEADPEVATFAVFEPLLVAEEFKEANRSNTHDQTLRRLHQQRKLILLDTQGDTDGTMHVYIDEAVPNSLMQFSRRSHQFDSFRVLGNSLHFAGIRGYVHPDEFHLSAKGVEFPVPAGCYSVCVHELDISRSFMWQLLAQRSSKRQFFMFKWFDTVMIIAAIIVLCCLVSLFFLTWGMWFGLVLLVAIPAFLTTQVWCRSEPYQQALRVYQSFGAELPSLVATFQPKAS